MSKLQECPAGGTREIKGGRSRPLFRCSWMPELLFINEVPAAILLPAGLVRFCAERLFFTIADGLDAIATDPALDECVFDGVRTIGAQGQVVFGGAALVAVTFDCDPDVGMLLQELSAGLQGSLLIRANVRLVVIEINVLHVLGEQLLFGQRRCWRSRCGRSIDRHTRGGILCAAGAL